MMRSLQWDIFCKVIDNFGDIGVCWRLAADLATRGHRVRLWVDDASALQWMAPRGHAGVRVLDWKTPLEPQALAEAAVNATPPDVLIEAFGCDADPAFLTACVHQRGTAPQPVWINLEYLSAEPYVERSHALPSPVLQGPAAGWTKWFFYPGFTQATGGLLREPGLQDKQAVFQRGEWLRAQGVGGQGEALVSLFCYEPAALAPLLHSFKQQGLRGQPVRLLVAAGRATDAVKAESAAAAVDDVSDGPMLTISYLPWLTQADFDHLLWSCDLNFVRGEDSVVRAIWAGKPFIWQIYPQDDEAHRMKLDAFLQMLQAPGSLQAFHAHWNGLHPAGAEPDSLTDTLSGLLGDLPAWQACVTAAAQRLQAQDDLATQLCGFALKNG
ncbi:elongation factor P maturation arginine rhamnosyltransferase EarP [Polaromonas sp. YR568]|uniref:elongation factor P maturation arginine rhamnosyltransferase EarP n=1 Tax=Polaromonas sp. YR568 TaxID=1855301 RepID=UPI003138248F